MTEAKTPHAGSGDPAYKAANPANVGRVPSPGDVGDVPSPAVPNEPSRRLRRLSRVWPDRDGNISYLLTACVEGRLRVLDNEPTFKRLVSFLLDSPQRYHWFGRRFVIMPDHMHLIAHQGPEAIRLGHWMKALKAVVGGLKPRTPPDAVGRVPSSGGMGVVSPPDAPAKTPHAGSGDPAYNPTSPVPVGRVPSPGAPSRGMSSRGMSSRGETPHEFIRTQRAWRWQDGFHDHKFRTPESETRKWEYVCLNPVRAGLVKRPEEWLFGGEIYYDAADGPRLIRGTPPLLESGMLIEEMPVAGGPKTPREGTRPTT